MTGDKNAKVETNYEYHQVCNECGEDFGYGPDAIEAVGDHSAVTGHSYSSVKKAVGYKIVTASGTQVIKNLSKTDADKALADIQKAIADGQTAVDAAQATYDNAVKKLAADQQTAKEKNDYLAQLNKTLPI